MKMRSHLWMEILMLGTAGALAFGLVFASLGAAAGAASGETEPLQAVAPSTPPRSSTPLQTYEGMVTCSRCGAKHSSSIARNASDCARICVHGGATFTLIDGDAVYILEGNLDQVKKVAGERAKITGAINGHTNIIEVSSVAAGS
jgi:hypothetical protein